MATIRTFVKGLLGGRPATKPPTPAAEPTHKMRGWVRIDTDNVMRGWAWDELDPARRQSVRLFIDDKAVGEVLADRPVEKLAEEGRGDGRYGFALVAPQAYRDGREHAFKAVVMAHAHRLKANALTFTIEPAATAPRLHLLEVSPTGLRARLRGGQYAKDAALELWSGGQRIDPALLTPGRDGAGPQAELTLGYSRELFLGLAPDAAVALPGMVEAGAGYARLFEEVRLRAEPRGGGLAVWLDGPLEPDGATSEVRVTAPDGRMLAREEVLLGREPVVLALPGDADPSGARVLASALAIAALETVVGEEVADGQPANLLRNAELNDWPHGVVVRGGPGRFELALGWHAQNRGSHGLVRAFATPLDFEGEACSLSLAADKVADYLRLEAEVVTRRPLAGRSLDVSFEAAIAQGPTGAFQSPEPFLLIDRVFLMGEAGSATVARNLVLTRRMRRFAFRVEAPADLSGPAVLAFDFKRPAAVTLQRPSLTLTPAGAPAPAPPLAFEDAGLEAQVALVEGLEPWASPQVLQPPPAPMASPGVVVPERAHPLGSIEVVVCVHDAADEALACLASLAAHTPLLHRVRIVDDASSEETVARLSGFIRDKPWMELERNPGHLGYTLSANRGIRDAAADWVVLLNSDTVVTPGWLEGLMDAASGRERVAMVGPLSNAASWQSVPELHDRAGKFKTNEPPPGWDPVRIAELIAAQSERAFPEVPLLNGFCTLIRREAFMSLGGFNEAAFPMGYGEENDLCLRMAEAGWKLVVADNVYVHHAKSASFGAERRKALQAEGMAALKRLHPGIDFAALGERMRETFALIRMRSVVREAWKARAG